MRAKIYIPVVLGLALLTAFLFWQLGGRQAADPLDFLPGDTVAMIDVRHPAALYDSYRKSRLGERLGSIPLAGLLENFGWHEADALRIQEAVDRVRTFLAGPVFQELFSRRTVLALLPAASAAPAHNAGNEPVWESLLLIARPRHPADFLELLAPLLAGTGQVETESYRGRELRTYPLGDGASLTVAACDGLLLAALSPATVKGSLDLGLPDPGVSARRLNSNPGYVSLRKQAAGRDEQFAFGDLGRFDLLAARTSVHSEKALRADKGNGQLGAMYCSSDDERLHCTVRLPGPAAGSVSPGTGQALPQPVADATLAGVPAEPALHFWTNLFDLARLWAEVRKTSQLQGLAAEIDQRLVRKTGMPLPQWLSLFGSELSVTATGMRGSGLLPLPRLYGRLAVRDQRQVEESLHKLLAVKRQESTDLAGIDVNTLFLAGGLIQPSYGFRDGYLYFADSPQELAQGLRPSAPALIGTDNYHRADIALEEPSNMIGYINVPRFIEALQQMVSWTAVILAMTDQERGGQIKNLADQLAVPLLDGMRMWSAGSARMLSSPEGMVMDAALVYAEPMGR